MEAKEIQLHDLETLIRARSPELADAVIAFLDQPDRYPRPAQAGEAPRAEEEPARAASPDSGDSGDGGDDGDDGDDDEDLDDDDFDEDEDDDDGAKDLPAGAMTVQALLQSVSARQLRWKSKVERRKIVRESWHRFLNQPDVQPPPRFQLAALLCRLYEEGSEPGRAALLDLAARAPLRFGLWAGLKRIYKQAEERLDAEMLGALASRFDREAGRSSSRGRDVSQGTLIYLRRRGWRFLRLLGQQVPELYPQFAVQVLRRYPKDQGFHGLWIPNHIWAHGQRRNFSGHSYSGSPPNDLLKHRAFDEAWKRSPDPLMLLLETAQADEPARFAIQALRRDFPDRLRGVKPEWLARLAQRSLSSVHDFLVETLQGSPELHQGKLRALGLHDTALSLLRSPSSKARAYAVEYARAHASDLPDTQLLDLLDDDDTAKEVRAFAAGLFKARAPRSLGYQTLGHLLKHDETKAFAHKALLESFERKEIPEAFLIDMIFGDSDQRAFATKFLQTRFQPGEIDPGLWRRVLDDKRAEDWEGDDAKDLAEAALGKFSAAQIGADWLLDALTKEHLEDFAAGVLQKADALPGLPVERVKGLVLSSRYRRTALKLLENTKLVKPRDLGLPWLLALARRADPALHEFAHRYLLQHLKPEDFADADGGRDAGVARLFALATGEKEPEPVRQFAQTYLRCHHPTLGPEQTESRQLQLKPQLKRDVYTLERVWPGLWDGRADVRRWAVAITKVELRRWGAMGRVYELAESEAKEVRNIAYEALLKAGEAGADPASTMALAELDAAKVFALTESRRRGTRDAGMELIRRHYAQLGGAERLGWLMDSPDREVRLFAVRLLWENHRPLHLPPGWKPKVQAAGAPAPRADAGRFQDVESLRAFLRRVLFGLPPGRSMEPREEAARRRRLPASGAKRNVIEIVRDLGSEDEAFARLVAPVLAEFTGSLARTEWQACLSALMTLRRVHPAVEW